MSKRICYLLLCVVFLGFAGCSGINSSDRPSMDQISLKLAKPLPISGFVDGTISVGKALGFQMIEANKNTSEIQFSKKTVLETATPMINRIIVTKVHLSFKKDAQIIVIAVTTKGTYGDISTNQTAVEKVITDFKTNLKKQFE